MSVLGSLSVANSYSASRDPERQHIQTQRPNVVRRETDKILSYYQSSYAGRSYEQGEQGDSAPNRGRRRSSASSSASSSYSVSEPSLENNSSNNDRFDYSSAATSPIQRRTSNHSAGGSDKRRVVIVEMDSEARDVLDDALKGLHNSQSALLARRGLDGYHISRLALMTALDAVPGSSGSSEPPMSAPLPDHKRSREQSSEDAPEISVGGHQRSRSEAVKLGKLQKKSSRDVGIVGTTYPTSPTRTVELRNGSYSVPAEPSPIFQTPSPSKPFDSNFHRAHSAAEIRENDLQSVAVSIKVAQSRSHNSDPERAVAGSSSRTAWSSISPHNDTNEQDLENETSTVIAPRSCVSSPYLYYQPGLHASAGPLPEPPRQILPSTNVLPPLRPTQPQSPTPTDKASLKHSLKLPDTVTAALARRAKSITESRENDIARNVADGGNMDASNGCASHSREAAYSGPSTETRQHNPNIEMYHDEESGQGGSSATSPEYHGPSSDVTVQVPRAYSGGMTGIGSQAQHGDVHQREASWIDIRGQLELADAKRSSSTVDFSKALPDLKASGSESPTKKIPSSTHLQTLDVNSKRFSSLPRTPSISSLARSSLYADHLGILQDDVLTRRRPVQKIKSRWPEAMTFADVLIKRNPHDRSVGYARKIMELGNHYSGLVDWVEITKRNLVNPHRVGRRGSLSSDTGPLDIRARHSSRNSISSEITFPRRLDAFAATDLSMRPSEEELPSGPPALPYPALAQSSRTSPSKVLGGLAANLSTRSVPSSITSGRSFGGVFASIGRKASLRRQQSITDNSPPKLLGRRQPTVPPNPRTIQINSTPTVLGGPRAPPGRVVRSQSTVAHPPNRRDQMITPSQQAVQSTTQSLKRSSSVAPSSYSVAPEMNDKFFDKQMEKLTDLLPHVDKKILAVYLRRTGQDVLAVGQYLEDERKGTIRTK